ncbi:hypothetical protein LILAB_04395 [Corallococcus macrosporus]|uniref:Uncharacterized protein n=2 Tax=Myxococcaceae TaxID=31 RepID=F8CM32_MYXFH|nr:hypothetical protein LILAB_04395 [Corallococcus macrosporus]
MQMDAQFLTPAGQKDFPDSEANNQQKLNALWTTNLTGFTQQGITGNPWNATNAADNTWYFNPLTTDTTGAGYASIQWSAFPGRLGYYYGGQGGTNASGLVLPDQDLLSLADTGQTTAGKPFKELPDITNPCTKTASKYGPYGPRGWQDEYCEWSVERDDKGNIVRIDFTCENPEYWNSLWMVDPTRVLELYRSTLGKPGIQLEDLYLKHPTSGQFVKDPSTGDYAYNPLNKWNCGPVSTRDAGGAMHLTSTPNTLQTEIGLAAAATVPREVGNSNAQRLICCAQYGQPARNSDPHIGQTVNRLVAPADPSRSPAKVTLANPPGLYIQMPDFSGYKTPDGKDASTFWKIVRGVERLEVPKGTPLPGNYILHATFQVPAERGYTVSDITINGQKIQWAGQVARTFLMQITGMGLPQKAPAPVRSCVGTPNTVLAQPLQCFHAVVFDALINTSVPNLMGEKMNLASNSTFIAPMVKRGQSNIPLVLTVAMVSATALPTVSFGDGITAKVTSMVPGKYAVPGNSYPGLVFILNLQVSVAPNAAPGLRGVCVTNARQQEPVAFPAALNVVAA